MSKTREAGLILILLGAVLAMCGRTTPPPRPPTPPSPSPTPSPAVLADCSTITESSGMYTCIERASDPSNPGISDTFLQTVEASKEEVILFHPELFAASGAFVSDAAGQRYIDLVTQAIRRHNLCAGIFHQEEVAVFLPSPRADDYSENWDLILSDGQPWHGKGSHRATCHPAVTVGVASDPTNGPFNFTTVGDEQ